MYWHLYWYLLLTYSVLSLYASIRMYRAYLFPLQVFVRMWTHQVLLRITRIARICMYCVYRFWFGLACIDLFLHVSMYCLYCLYIHAHTYKYGRKTYQDMTRGTTQWHTLMHHRFTLIEYLHMLTCALLLQGIPRQQSCKADHQIHLACFSTN